MYLARIRIKNWKFLYSFINSFKLIWRVSQPLISPQWSIIAWLSLLSKIIFAILFTATMRFIILCFVHWRISLYEWKYAINFVPLSLLSIQLSAFVVIRLYAHSLFITLILIRIWKWFLIHEIHICFIKLLF